MSTMTGTLVAMQLPHAIVSISGVDAVQEESFRVRVDDLVPSRLQKTEEPPTEPALVPEESATLALPTFDFEQVKEPVLRSMAVYALNWLFITQPDHTLALKILLLSKEGDLPYQFQVRVIGNIPFKKGTLILAPWVQLGGAASLVSKGSADSLQLVSKKKTEKVVHESLCTSANLSMRAIGGQGEDPKRKKAGGVDSESTVEEHYYVLSPLLLGKKGSQREAAYSNLAPFWAVPRCARVFPDKNNMELQTVPLDLPALKDSLGIGLSKRKAPIYRATVQVMINKKTVKPGEVLTLPFADASEPS